MSVTKKDVQYVAHLARLQLTDREAEQFTDDLSKILDYMETLEELDTSDVKPLEHVIELEYRLRDDRPETPLSNDEALKNAPDTDGDYFRVPKVID